MLLSATAVLGQEDGRQISTIYRYTPADSIYIEQKNMHAGTIRYRHADSALIMLDSNLAYCMRIRYFQGVGHTLLVKGLCLIEKGLYDSAIATILFARPFLGETPGAQVPWLNNLAQAYAFSGSYNAALKTYYQAINKLEKLANPLITAITYHNIARLWIHLDDTAKGRTFLSKALHETKTLRATAEKSRNVLALETVASIYNTTASLLMVQEEYPEALQYIRKSTLVSDFHPMLVKCRYQSKLQLAEYYLRLGQSDSAAYYCHQIIESDIERNPYHTQLVPYSLLSRIYSQREDYPAAIRYGRIAESIAAGKKIRGYAMLEILEILADAYVATGQSDSAIRYFQKLANVYYEDFNTEKIQLNEKLDFAYQSNRKDRELADQQLLLLQKDNLLRKRNVMILIAGAGLLFLSMIIYMYHNRQQLQQKALTLLKKEKEIRSIKDVMETAEAERRRIGAELHDGIGGMLAAIKMNLATMRKRFPDIENAMIYQETYHMVQETADEIRKTAHNLLPEILLNSDLNQAITSYINQFRDKDLAIEFSNNHDPELLSDNVKLTLFRVIQELLQNVVKHAAATKVSIHIMQLDRKLHIIFEDNGVGFSPESKHEGRGLYNIRTRIMALNGIMTVSSSAEPGHHTSFSFEFDIENLIDT